MNIYEIKLTRKLFLPIHFDLKIFQITVTTFSYFNYRIVVLIGGCNIVPHRIPPSHMTRVFFSHMTWIMSETTFTLLVMRAKTIGWPCNVPLYQTMVRDFVAMNYYGISRKKRFTAQFFLGQKNGVAHYFHNTYQYMNTRRFTDHNLST